MFCPKCGSKLPEGANFCGRCGAPFKYNKSVYEVQEEAGPEPAEEVMPEMQAEDTDIAEEAPAVPPEPKEEPVPEIQEEAGADPDEPLRTVIYGKNGETVLFYPDRLIYEGNTIFYEEIDAVSAGGSTVSSSGLVVTSHFSGHVRFELTDGTKVNLKVGGTSVYGMGSTKAGKERFLELMRAVYQVVCRAVAQRLYNRIRQGETVEVAGILLSEKSASLTVGLRKIPVTLTRENFGEAVIKGDVLIFDKAGKRIVGYMTNVNNAMVLPYLLNTLYQ